MLSRVNRTTYFIGLTVQIKTLERADIAQNIVWYPQSQVFCGSIYPLLSSYAYSSPVYVTPCGGGE